MPLAAPDLVGLMVPLPLCRPDGIPLAVLDVPPLHASPHVPSKSTLLNRPLLYVSHFLTSRKVKCAMALAVTHALAHALYRFARVFLRDPPSLGTPGPSIPASTIALIPLSPLLRLPVAAWAVLRVALPFGLLTTMSTPLRRSELRSVRPRSYPHTIFGMAVILRQRAVLDRVVSTLSQRPALLVPQLIRMLLVCLRLGQEALLARASR